MTHKSPAFSCYPKDLLSDAKVARMSNEEFGAYWRLVCYSWEEPLPNDLADLALMLPRTTVKQMESMWRVIGPCFSPHPTEPGKIIQARVEEERQKQVAFREKQAEHGRRGGRPIKTEPDESKKGYPFDTLTEEKGSGSETESQIKAKKSLSSSTSSSNTVATATASPEAAKPPKLPLVDEATLAAKKILAAIWPRVAVSLADAMTKTEWGKRNMRYARDLVAANADLQAIVEAHERVSKRLGAPAKMLSLVQDELSRSSPAKSPKRSVTTASCSVCGNVATGFEAAPFVCLDCAEQAA